MAFVGPKGRGDSAGGAQRRGASTVGALVLASAVVGGWLGDEFRWLGGVALSEVVVTRGLWWSGLLRRRRWARLGLRLATAAVLLQVLGIAMPDASLVGWVFLFGALSGLAWVGVLRLAGLHVADGGVVVAMMVLAAAVGLWFDVAGVPPSGWSPIVAVLVGATALEAAARRAPDGLGQ